MKRFAAAIVVIASSAGGVAGCSMAANAPPNTINNHCAIDSDCVGSVCDSVLRVCVTTSARTELVLSAAPPASGTSASAAPTVLASQEIDGSRAQVDIPLRATRAVVGVVTAPALTQPGQPLVPIPAGLRFHRRGASSLEADVTAESVSDPTSGTPGQTYSFIAALTPGEYDVTVTPRGDWAQQCPPWFDALSVQLDANGLPQALAYSYSVEYSVTQGTITDAAGHPIPGLTVRALDGAAGHALISTTATTDGSGMFSIALASGRSNSDWILEVRTELDRAATFQAPQYMTRSSFQSEMVHQIARSALSTDRSGLAVHLPSTRGLALAPATGVCNQCVIVQQRVEGTLASGTTVAVPGTVVQFQGQPALGPVRVGTATFRGQAVVDADGYVEMAMPPGEYDATLTPSGDQLAVTQVHFVVGEFPTTGSQIPEQRGAVLSLGRRIEVNGSVVTAPTAGSGARNMPMAGVEVTAYPLDGAARTTRGFSIADGSFRLALDPGRYRLVAAPPANSGFATAIHPVVLELASGSGSVVLAEPVQLASPFALRGTVLDANHAPVAGAVVHAFAGIRSGDTPLNIEVAQATADATGHYQVLVPSALTP